MLFEERLLKIIKRRYNYDDEQLDIFSRNERNKEVLDKINELNETIIKLTVVESHGCNSQHKIGDAIYFDGAGNILTKYCPAKICSYLLSNANMLIFTSNEFIYAGISPMQMKFRRCSCFDVGVRCGGLGKIVLELSIMRKKEMEDEITKRSI